MKRMGAQKVLGHVDRLASWGRGARPAPVTVEWDLSNRCVLGCQDCHFAHTHVRGPWARRDTTATADFSDTGNLASVPMVTRALGEMAGAGVQAVVWSGGGEPTTHPEWEHLISVAQSHGLKQGMYTCGGLIDKDSGAALAQAASWVVVSLDTVDAATYAREKGVSALRFHDATRGIRHLARSGECDVGVSFLLHAGNWEHAPRMAQLVRQHGATYATFRPAIRTSPADPAVCADDRAWITLALPMLEELATVLNVELDPERFTSYRDWKSRQYPTCYGVRLNTTVTPDGRVWLCPQHRGLKHSLLGHLTTESFDTLWQRHPGQWQDFSKCRVMCRLHLMNEVLAPVFAGHRHPEFL